MVGGRRQGAEPRPPPVLGARDVAGQLVARRRPQRPRRRVLRSFPVLFRCSTNRPTANTHALTVGHVCKRFQQRPDRGRTAVTFFFVAGRPFCDAPCRRGLCSVDSCHRISVGPHRSGLDWLFVRRYRWTSPSQSEIDQRLRRQQNRRRIRTEREIGLPHTEMDTTSGRSHFLGKSPREKK